MSRDLPVGFAAETEKSEFPPIVLVALDFPDGMVRCWTGYGNITWDGNVYAGTGELGSITPFEESSDRRANGVVLTLSGIPTARLIDAMANDALGRSGQIYIGALLPDLSDFATDPYLILDGLIDITPVKFGPETSTISVHLEKEMIDRRLKQRRYTHEDQQVESPGDGYFKQTAALVTMEFTWGGKSVGGSPVAAGGVADTSETLE